MGPLLFLLYISKILDFYFIADDTNIYYEDVSASFREESELGIEETESMAKYK